MRGKEVLEKLVGGKRLSQEEAKCLMEGVIGGTYTPVQLGAILAVLQVRGESGEELSGFVEAIRERALPFVPSFPAEVADNCGTGGDGTGTFNISTAAALLAVSVGVKVVKHGNRSVTSLSGSADFLECLGIPVDMPPEVMHSLFAQTGFAFLYAPRYHPAMRAVQGVRKELGIRTVFNLLGPLANPCAVHYKLVGVYDPGLIEPVAKALGVLGIKRGLVVWGEPGMDEVSLVGESRMVLVEAGKMTPLVFHPREVGLETCLLSDLQGGNPDENVALFFDLLRGKYRGPLKEALLLNAAFLVWLSGQAGSVTKALFLLEEALDQGRALRIVEKIVAVVQEMEVAS